MIFFGSSGKSSWGSFNSILAFCWNFDLENRFFVSSCFTNNSHLLFDFLMMHNIVIIDTMISDPYFKNKVN